MIRFGREVSSNLLLGSSREWLETNAIGGFASSTILGLNTRRYHGLLVAATMPPVGRMVLLSTLEETLIVDGARTALSANRYPGVIHPKGYRFLSGFRLDPFPTWTYLVGEIALEKSVFMVQGENTTVVRYVLTAVPPRPPSIQLELRPLIACRDYHALTHENSTLDPRVDAADRAVVMRPYAGVPALHISYGRGHVARSGHWYRRFEYEAEQARGLDFAEDLFNPCVLTIDLEPEAPAVIAASTAPVDRGRVEGALDVELARRRAIADTSPCPDPLVLTLVDAADRFIVARGRGSTVIAGYHWFSDWGRDTMIALPGLTLETGRTSVAAAIIREFLQHADRGMIPNRFPDAGAAEYTSVDATLWLFHAMWQLLARTDDDVFAREAYDGLAEIIDWHVRGTRHAIRVGDDGLLNAGPADMPLTWMDVRIGDRIVTPRFGKPVEVQALWYNALCVMETLAARVQDEPRRTLYSALATRARRSFNRQYWNAEAGCLYDVVGGPAPDASIRPNQVIALSLPFSMVPREQALSVLDVVERTLLTPYGLRTLAPADPAYRGRYEGDARSRDEAYHQGTVWPWLFGPFADAYLRVHRTATARRRVVAWLEPFRRHLLEAGLGQVSEIFDGDPPHRPAGCIAQAWSVAEVLRIAATVFPPAHHAPATVTVP